MRTGITVDVSAADHACLEAIVADRNSPQKHVCRARIVLLTAAGLGTNEIMRQTGRSKTCLWRIPHWKHDEISSWYSKPNIRYGDVSPRNYLRGKSWDKQYRVGLKVLRDFGVLK